MSEVRLIDANALIKEICSDCALFLDKKCDGERISCYPSSIVRKQPTVDAVPVRHGHWEIVPNDESGDDYYKMRCSVCGETLWSIQSEELYCCKCGAKMDE